MNIQSALRVLLSIFGLMLLGLLWSQGSSTYRDYAESSEQIIIDLARNDLLAAIIEMQKDRTRIELSGTQIPSGPLDHDILAKSVASLRHASETLLGARNVTLADLGAAVDQEVDVLHTFSNDLVAAIASDDPDATMRQKSVGLEQIDFVQRRLLVVRQELLAEVGIIDSTMSGLQLMRNYVLSVNSGIQQNRVLILSELKDGPFLPPDAAIRAADHTRALQAADHVFLEMIRLHDETMIEQSANLSDFLRVVYGPVEADFLRALSTGEDVAAARLAWANAVAEADQVIERVLTFVFEQSQAHLEQKTSQSLNVLERLLGLSVAALMTFVLSLYIISRHILQPLERVRSRMLEIASGNLAAGKRENFRLIDLQAMAEALRVFRVDAVRRERMTHERLSLHAKIAEAHNSLQSDMRAAAEVQLAQMPEPGDVGQVRFSTFFAASHVLAGDTFDYLPLSEDRVGLFQVDVAGHGAAAGLVSVAAHIGARRALSGLAPDASLANAIETLNASWNPEMTYFTMVSIELDVRANTGRLVQAGHPNPVLMRKDGSITRLGHGGLPIGVLPDADFEEIAFPFEAGDRLFVFSDGIYENMNENGEIFTEARFINLLADNAAFATDAVVAKVRKMLEEWGGSGTLSDDVSLVVAERI